MERVGQWRKCQNVSHLPGQEFYIIFPLSSPWRGNKEINPPLKPSERAFKKRFSLYIRVNGIHSMIRSRFIHTLTWGKGQRERVGKGGRDAAMEQLRCSQLDKEKLLRGFLWVRWTSWKRSQVKPSCRQQRRVTAAPKAAGILLCQRLRQRKIWEKEDPEWTSSKNPSLHREAQTLTAPSRQS